MEEKSLTEFTAVVLAGGAGSRLYPLTEDIPKPLVPVVNVPLLSYQLEYLEQVGFAEVIVVTQQAFVGKVGQYINEIYKGKVHIQLECVDEFMGTADVLRLIKDKIRTDFVVMSGDLVTDVPVHFLADIHRIKDASCTVLLSRCAHEEEKEKKSNKKNEEVDADRYLIGLDQQGQRLLYFRAAVDIEQEFVLKKSILKRYPCMRMNNSLRDAHLYIFSHWVLDLLEHKRNISSIQGELVPYLVSRQFSSRPLPIEMEDKSEDPVRCYAFIAPENALCERINTVPSFWRINRKLAVGAASIPAELPPSAQVGKDCVIGEGAKIGEKTSIKSCLIGKHCKIASQVKLANCILMDYATIEDKCQVSGSIICPNAHIGERSVLTDCIVGSSYSLSANSEHKNETLSNSRQ